MFILTFEGNPVDLYPNHMAHTIRDCSLPQKFEDGRLDCGFFNSAGNMLEIFIFLMVFWLLVESIGFVLDSKVFPEGSRLSYWTGRLLSTWRGIAIKVLFVL